MSEARLLGLCHGAALYSFATGLVEQAGSRRGATMICLADWHPDIREFIHSKRETGKITNANISVLISDAFMGAVQNDEMWRFVFPDTTHPDYDDTWNGDLGKWNQSNKPVISYDEIPARELWREIMESAWDSAEPGLLFLDRANADSNSWYYNRLISSNPCGEQFLSGWSVCNLSHVNLSKMTAQLRDGISVNWVLLRDTVKTVVKFLDNVIDVTPYHHPENEKVQKGERRIGVGTMGFAELLIKLGIRYGSDESVEIAERIQRNIAESAYIESSDIALQKGSFPEFDADKYLASGFMQPNAV